MKKISIIGLIVFLVLNSLLLYISNERVANDINDDFSAYLIQNNKDHYNSFIDEVANNIQKERSNIFRELSLFGDIIQRYFDHSDDFSDITDVMKENPYFKDDLTYSGIWYQNSPNEPSTVHVQRYLLDENNEIKSHVRKLIDDSVIMDLMIPTFMKYGIDKQLLYYQGPVEGSFARLAPWVDLGNLMNDVYPAYTDEPTWETFNPGLVGQWEDLLISTPGAKDDNKLLVKASSPVQDGVTGQIVITFSYPIWNKERTEFLGAIGYDVFIDQMLELVENIKFEESGFAFLSQANGNLFAVNPDGAELLGFGSAEEHTDVTGEGIGFNRLNRMFADSQIESVSQIELPTSDDTLITDITIENEVYTLVLKRTEPFQTWHQEPGFIDEHWVLGFVIPRSSDFYVYSELDRISKNNSISLMILQSMLIIVLAAFIFFTYKKKNKKSEL